MGIEGSSDAKWIFVPIDENNGPVLPPAIGQEVDGVIIARWHNFKGDMWIWGFRVTPPDGNTQLVASEERPHLLLADGLLMAAAPPDLMDIKEED